MKNILARSLVLLAGISLVSSCMKKPSEDSEEGSLVDNKTYQSALQNAWGSRYILDNPAILFMKKGEATLLLKDVALNNSNDNTKLLRAEKLEIRDIIDIEAPPAAGEKPDPTLRIRKFQISQEVQEYSQNSESKPIASVREIPIRYQNGSSFNESMTAESFVEQDLRKMKVLNSSRVHTMEGEYDGAEYGFERVASFLYACDQKINPKIQCQDFQYTDTEVAPPENVKNAENCRGIPGCKIKKRNFVLNMILNTEDEVTHAKLKIKAYYEFSISKDVPYLARLTDFCLSQIVTTQNGKIPARFCHRIQDFKFE